MARPIRPQSRQEPPAPPKRERSLVVHTLLTLIKVGLAAIALCLVALAVAVAVAMSSLPGFDQLKSSQNGQMIRVHAVDGTVLVSIGP
ncbi:MAG TPA: hypothetical protein VGC10_02880, partial [Sphingomonas sp.]